MSDITTLDFPRSDVRRLFCVMLALHESQNGLSLNALAAATGFSKPAILQNLERFHQFGVIVEKVDFVYRVVDWGPVIKRTGLRKLLVAENGDGEAD